MSKNPCATCSKESVDRARSRPCWDDKLCHQRRSRHRNRDRVNLQRREQYQQERGFIVEQIDLVVPQRYYAEVVFHRDRVSDPLQLIQFRLYLAGELVAQSQQINCLGLQAAEIKRLMVQALTVFNTNFGLDLKYYSSRQEIKLK